MSASGATPSVLPEGQAGSIFEQFPLSCATTYSFRQADVRRAVAYKGYLRADIGHHVALGVNEILNFSDFFQTLDSALNNRWGPEDWQRFERGRNSRGVRLRSRLSTVLGRGLMIISPLAEQRRLPYLNAWFYFASVFHFKWSEGLRQRFRLLQARGWSTNAAAQQLTDPSGLPGAAGLENLEQLDRFPVQRICSKLRPGLRRALSAEEMLPFFLRWNSRIPSLVGTASTGLATPRVGTSTRVCCSFSSSTRASTTLWKHSRSWPRSSTDSTSESIDEASLLAVPRCYQSSLGRKLVVLRSSGRVGFAQPPQRTETVILKTKQGDRWPEQGPPPNHALGGLSARRAMERSRLRTAFGKTLLVATSDQPAASFTAACVVKRCDLRHST
eukprot:TRINITY_DN38746_c0_g1_i2.p1 TRINITY_DN38746_c0_g1~~TRINITY_DN38746_c0_g1_i2.p1  ORF type:complete len:447 (+),score=42.91 TRINITY_DN38746_c0_g1_i2:181-1341(+)